jgi:hypothetical protein
MDLKFGTWYIRDVCRAGSLESVASELAKPNLDLVAVQEVRWDKGGSEPAYDLYIYAEMWMLIIT